MTATRFKSESELLKILAHPTRLRVVDLLRDGARCVSDLLEAMDIGQSALSQHLALMRHAGVLGTERDGLHIQYYIRRPIVLKIVDVLIYETEENSDEPARESRAAGEGRRGR